MECPYCKSKANDFVLMNQTNEYSGIDIGINRQGMLRIRVFDFQGNLITQDIIEIKHCPLCGNQFVKGK